MSVVEIERNFVRTREGLVHYAAAGAGEPVLLLHQTPRSWDEYRDVIPLLAARYRSIAMDTIGFGDSEKPDRASTVDDYARGVVAFLDAIEIERASIVGHHTGGVVAVEVAATHPDRVEDLVLSGTTCPDEEGRQRAAAWPHIDHVEPRADGSHLLELWEKRKAYYPPHRADLLHRLMIDSLKVIDRVEEGHIAVNSYRIEDKLPLVRARTLLMCGTEDWAAYPDLHRLATYLPDAEIVEIPGGGVPLDEEMPETFARVVMDFLAARD